MSERIDLTRWNRAGLTRFRYVDGNAVEYLEILRQKLVEQFADPKTGSCDWLNPPEKIPANEAKQENETLIQRLERLSLKQKRILETYHQDRRDWAWEITRTFARSCHILTEYANAYANEGYLGTATQWDHLRRLVEMLDYHPAPPASASTRLFYVAKGDKPGIIAKGFQVKNSPPTGGDKVIFETLEDLFIDPALNELRPKGWNQSDDPAVSPVSPDDNGSTQPPAEEQQFSSIANGPAINLQGVGETWALQLNTLSDNEEFKIKDFLDLDPENPGIILDPADPDFELDPEDPGSEIGVIRLRELKAKATEICNFRLESNWSNISGWFLPNIASESADSLAEITGNPLDIVQAFQQRIELTGAFLDHGVYENAKLEDLLVPVAAVTGTVATSWHAKRKPKIAPEDVAMIYREFIDENTGKSSDGAEAATIAGIEKQTEIIHLKLSPVQRSWPDWKKSEARLKVAPRWQRKCWLNGENVIRTVDPHGLSADSYIGWKGYDLLLQTPNAITDLKNEGRSLVIVGQVDLNLYIRIFDSSGARIDKLNDQPLGIEDLAALQGRTSLPDPSSISQEYEQEIIESATSIAGITQWMYAKIIDADKRELQLGVVGSLPQKGTKLYELRPIEGSILPADYEAIVLINDNPEEENTTPEVEDVAPNLDVTLGPDKPEIESIFTLKKFIPDKIKSGEGVGSGGGGGGGLLPPASLPKIGSFLFPSPMLPLDLVKAAVELMLSIGVMVIPSTGDIVIKGMPFGGLLEDAGDDPAKAAEQLFDMLHKLEGTVQECNQDGELLWVVLNNDGTEGYDIYVEPAEDEVDRYKRDTDGQLVPFQIQQTSDGLPSGDPLYKLKNGGSAIEGLITYGTGNDDIVLGSADDPYLRDGDNVLVPAYVVEKLAAWEAPFTKTVPVDPADSEGPQKTVPDKEKIVEALTKLMDTPTGKEVTSIFQQITNNLVDIGPLLAIPKEEPYVLAEVDSNDPLYIFDGEPDKIETSDWVVGHFTDGHRALKIVIINEFTDSDNTKFFSLSFDDLIGDVGRLQKVYANFRGELTPEDANINEDLVDPDGIELEDVPESLKVGSDILLTAEGEEPVEAKIESLDGNTIKTRPPATGFTKGSLIIRGNVVLAGHGESKPQKILGSGDATQSNQEFTLAVDAVSFTPDVTMSSGVAAAIDVEVAGRIWEQVSTLKDSAPDDHHYAIRMTEAGYVKILFGDGQNGRRLPSGKNNLRVRYRVGSGIIGNLAAASLEKPVNPHPLIETVHQPLPATGGGDMEGLTSLRVNAPPTLLALERAVSLSDFSHLAAAQSSIWQAQAYSQILQGGRMQSVRVVIVPAGGVSSEDIENDIKKFLQKHALPGVQVSVSNFETVLFDLMITVRVNSDEFIPAEVQTAVTSALTNHFTLRNRKLGEHLYLSEIYKIVEGVHGVENSICVLNNDENLKVIEAVNQSTVIYLDPDAGSSLAVTAEEYLP